MSIPSKTYRTFIAFPVADADKERLYALQRSLQRNGLRCRWVNPELFHVTAAFLGEVNIRRITQVVILTQAFQEKMKPLRLVVSGVDGFPSDEGARTVYASLAGKSIKHFIRLVSDIRTELRKHELVFDTKPFVPHITIGRSKIKRSLVPYNEKGVLKTDVTFSDVGVYISELKDDVLEYKRIKID